MVRRWWSTTTDKRYLEAEISFRQRWPWVLPAFSLVNLVLDILTTLENPCMWVWLPFDVSVVLVVSTIRFNRGLLGTLWIDFFVILMFLAGGIVAYDLTSVDSTNIAENSYSADYIQCLYTPVQYPFIILFALLSGFHSSVSALVVGACVLQVLCNDTLYDGLGVVMMTASIGAAVACFEYSAAKLFLELHRQHECNQLLLDGATDGFGVVDSKSGVLVSVSPKMLETFGCSDLHGKNLDTLVDAADRAALPRLFGSVDKGIHSTPVLVTCSSPTLQFDVRLVPYKMDGTKIGFCVQVVGESRSLPCHQNLASIAPHELRAHDETNLEGCSRFEAVASQSNSDDIGTCLLQQDHLHSAKEGAKGQSSLQEWMMLTSGKRSTTATLSLSSWTAASVPGHVSIGIQTSMHHRAETQEVSTQASERRRPPKPPSTGATSSSHGLNSLRRRRQADGRQRSRTAGQSAQIRVSDSIPAVKTFHPTPRSTAHNSLAQLTRCMNVAGCGCCTKHMAWTFLLEVVSQELAGRCEQQVYASGWQCPICFSINDWDDDCPAEDGDYMCTVCAMYVQPEPPMEHQAHCTSSEESVTAYGGKR